MSSEYEYKLSVVVLVYNTEDLLEECRDSAKRREIARKFLARFPVPESKWDGESVLMTADEGTTYWVAGDYEGYMKKMYGAKWKTRSVERYLSGTERLRLIWDTECPYEDYLEFLGEDRPVLKEIIMDRRDYTQWMYEVHSPLEKETLMDFLEIRRSVDRIDVWMTLKDRMEEIRDAGNREDTEELRQLLEDYLERTDYFYSENIGFYINSELFSLAAKVWEADGRTGYAEKVYALVPEHYRRESVEDYLNQYLEER